MSLNKAIRHGKEHRKPFRGHDPTCRPHGSCPYCANGRKHAQKVADIAAAEEIADALAGPPDVAADYALVPLRADAVDGTRIVRMKPDPCEFLPMETAVKTVVQ